MHVLLPTCNQQYGYEQVQSLPQRNSSPTHQPISTSSLGVELDTLLQRYSGDQFLLHDAKRPCLSSCTQSSSKPVRCFTAPKTEDEISAAKASAIPAKTLADTKYCIGIWNKWYSYRLTKYGVTIPPLMELSTADLANYP